MAISGWGVFLIILVLAVVGGAGGYIGYAHYRARKLGLPPPNLNPFSKNRRDDNVYRAPAPAPGGIQGWISDKIDAFRNRRTAGGAYESTSRGGGGGGRRGFGPLDPDEAWDARVDNEASGYYEEQELGLQDPGHGPYGGGGYGHGHSDSIGRIGGGRGRSQQRELDDRYDEEMHGGSTRLNPFGDHAETSNASLRSISPRPADTGYHGAHHKKVHGNDDSPTERRSMFTENM